MLLEGILLIDETIPFIFPSKKKTRVAASYDDFQASNSSKVFNSVSFTILTPPIYQ